MGIAENMKLILILSSSACAQYAGYDYEGNYDTGISYDQGYADSYYGADYYNATYGEYDEYNPNYDYTSNYGEQEFNPDYYDIYSEDLPSDETTDAEVANDYVEFAPDYVEEVEEEGEVDYGEDGFERARPRPNIFDPFNIGNDSKYFFTTTTTTGAPTTAATTVNPTTVPTTVPVSSWKCWHCDETSLALCFQNGAEKECHQGDYGSCMLEVTEENGNMRNICMGCKQQEACEAAKLENFWDFLPTAVATARYNRPIPYDYFTKCKPEDAYNAQYGRSHCRQCCYTDNCFGLNGFTDANGNLEAWTDVVDWDRT